MGSSTDNLYAFRPAQALDALRHMARDPDDIKHVVRFVGALQGRAPLRILRRMRRSKTGRRLLREKPELLSALKNRDWLASLPEGTVGRAYYDFCMQESLTPGGLDTALHDGVDWERFARVSDDERFLQLWMRDTHDLIHVLTGYRTDIVGEMAVLTFSVTKTRNPGLMMLVLLAVLGLRASGHPQPRIFLNAIARSLRAGPVFWENWRELLEQPLDEVRRKLRVGPVPDYEPLYTKLDRTATAA